MVIFTQTKPTIYNYVHNLLFPKGLSTNLRPLRMKIFKFQVKGDLTNRGFIVMLMKTIVFFRNDHIKTEE